MPLEISPGSLAVWSEGCMDMGDSDQFTNLIAKNRDQPLVRQGVGRVTLEAGHGVCGNERIQGRFLHRFDRADHQWIGAKFGQHLEIEQTRPLPA